MGLKLTLQPTERVLLDGVVIRNPSDKHSLTFIVETHAVILRERDFMTAEQATSPARRVYLNCQYAMLDHEQEDQHRSQAMLLITDLIGALRAPEAIEAATSIAAAITERYYHHALKGLQHLIDYEDIAMGRLAAEAEGSAEPTEAPQVAA